MGKILYLDPFGGAAGDMLLGALLDLGVDETRLRAMLDGLHLPGWRLEAARDRQQGFAGTRVGVVVDEASNPARRLADVAKLLKDADLPPRVRERALAAFRRLFGAEAKVHGVAIADAHLHELAAVDAVVDIVGVCAAVELLGVERVESAPVPVGSGTVETQHGRLPVPPPAVAELLAGVPLAAHAADGEMTTPTGATLLVSLVERFGAVPAGRIRAVGVGLGTRKHAGLPNLLRAFLIDEGTAQTGDRPLVVVETTVDDVTGEHIAAAMEGVLASGAIDVWCLSGTGRKGRPVQELCALCEPSQANAVIAHLFTEGFTLGVRLMPCTRPELERRTIAVSTPYGEIPVKLGVFEGKIVSAKPEHDACVAAAKQCGVSLATVVDAARAASSRLGSGI